MGHPTGKQICDSELEDRFFNSGEPDGAPVEEQAPPEAEWSRCRRMQLSRYVGVAVLAALAVCVAAFSTAS